MSAATETKKGLLANLFTGDRWNSRITSANTTRKEIILGYFIGPWAMLMTNSIVVSYFNQYLTDVVGFTVNKGAWIVGFMALFPLFSKLLDAVTNVVMSKLLDMTVCRQGKVRPWYLISIPFVVVSIVMLFWMPFQNTVVQAIWVVVAYNLYYSVAYTMWNMSKELGVALSTRNINQRRTNSLSSQLVNNMGTGALSIIFPTILAAFMRAFNGDSAKGYFYCMAMIAVLVIPLTFVQYFYTRERVTEERRAHQELLKDENKPAEAPFKEQMKACLSDKYWVVFMLLMLIVGGLLYMRTIDLVYYSGWVVNGNQYGQFEVVQRRFQIVAMQPMFLGIFLVLPLMKKWGRRKVIWVGATLMIVGSTIAYLGAGSSMKTYAGSALAGFGAIAYTYLMYSFMGDCIDHVEWKSGVRCDGFTSAVFGIISMVSVGVSQGIFNLGLGMSGYTQPEFTGEIINGVKQYADQLPSAVQWLNFAYQGTYIVSGVILFVVFLFIFKIEDDLPMVEAELQERHRAEYAAKGLVYVSPAEKEAQEIAEQEREAEENRIRELKEKCARKGLDFEAENAKVLAKRAEQKAKADMKAAKRAARANKKK